MPPSMSYIPLETDGRIMADPYAQLRDMRERKRATRRQRIANRVKHARKVQR